MSGIRSGRPRSIVRAGMLGITVIELLVTLSIAVILMTVAVPGFNAILADTRQVAAVNELVGALSMARSEAIKRGVRVTICKTTDPYTASPACVPTAGWNESWLLFVDNDHEPGNSRGVIDGGDQLLRIFSPSDVLSITTGVGYSGGISYRANGMSQGLRSTGGVGLANGRFTLCAGAVGRDIVINSTGRVMIEQVSC